MLKGQPRALGDRRLLRAALGYFAMGISVAIAQPSSTPADELEDLFGNAMELEEARASTEPSVVRTRAVRVNVDLIAPPASRRGAKLRLNLFDDVSLVAIFDRSEV